MGLEAFTQEFDNKQEKEKERPSIDRRKRERNQDEPNAQGMKGVDDLFDRIRLLESNFNY